LTHADVSKHLADYLEGDLALEHRAKVDAHLDSCGLCSRDVKEMSETIRLLRTLPEPELPPMISANVMRRIRAGESRPGFFVRSGRALRSVLEPTFVLPASAIAVAALVVAVTQGSLTQSIVGPQALSQQASSAQSGPGGRGVILDGRDKRGIDRGSLDRGGSMASVLSPSTSRYARTGIADSARSSQRRIRLRVDGSGVARVSMSGLPASRRGSTGTVLASRRVFNSAMPAAWVAEFSRIMFADPDVLAADTLFVADRSGRASEGFVRSVARSRVVPQDRVLSDLGRDERDPRDAWLALGFENPSEFAQYIAGRNLAEQELWAARLSERAEARGLLADFLQTLRESGDTTAAWIADDFSAQAKARSNRDASQTLEASLR
jgi:hypothetical protein